MKEFALPVISLLATNNELILFDSDVEITFSEAGYCQRDPQPFTPLISTSDAFYVVWRVAVTCLGKALQRLFHRIKA